MPRPHLFHRSVALAALALMACTSSTTTGGSSAQDTALLDDVNLQPETLGGGSGSDVGALPDPGSLCQDLNPGDDIWVPETGDFVMRDRQTGSLWNVRGQAFEGPCRGAQLAQVPAFTVFWFSWSTSRDGGSIWNQEAPNDSAAIRSDESGDCNVPCSEIRSGGPPPDGIPALDYLGRWSRPRSQQMVSADDPEADYLGDFDIVLGVYLNGQARAYPHALLNWHENHVDAIDGVEFNMTYCPLTGSGILIPADQAGSEPVYLYVSGRLYNDNLTMFERETDEPTFWNQMLLRGIRGPRAGVRLEYWPVVETTWLRWQQMHPGTLVASGNTGYTQSLRPNPYTSRQDEDASTLFPVNPMWDQRYPNKARVLAVDGESESRAYPFAEMDQFGDRVVINDVLEDRPILVVYEAEHRMAIPYEAEISGTALTFDGTTAP